MQSSKKSTKASSTKKGTATKKVARQPKPKTRSTKALPPAMSQKKPIARLKAAASRAALPSALVDFMSMPEPADKGKAPQATSAPKKNSAANGKPISKPKAKGGASTGTSKAGKASPAADKDAGKASSAAGKAKEGAASAKTSAKDSVAKPKAKAKPGTTKSKAAPGGGKTAGKAKAKPTSGAPKVAGNGESTSVKGNNGTSPEAKAKPAKKPASTNVESDEAHTNPIATVVQKVVAATKAAKSKKAPETQKGPKHVAKPEGAAGVLYTAREKLIGTKDWVAANATRPPFIAAVTVLVIYVVCSLVFTLVFMPGTTINGKSATMRTAAAVTSHAQDTSNDYKLTVDGDGMDLSFSGADIDLAFDADTFANEVSTHLFGWAWPVGVFANKDYDVQSAVSFNEDAVHNAVSSAADAINKNATQPKNATITYDASKKSFVASTEAGGTAVSKDASFESACTGIRELKDHVELGDAELQQPAISVSSPSMQQAIEKANELGNAKIDLTVNGNTVKTVDGELVRPWLKVDESYNVTADLDAVTDWAKTDLSAEIDTVGTARTYTRTNDGKRIEVYGGGTYGWNMDSEEFAKDLVQSIETSSSEPIEIPMKTRGVTYVHGKQDWGPRYVDVDLSEQYVRMFDEDSNIVMESSCVSGNLSENNDTVTGVFALENKASPMILVGLDENGDGEPDYENEVQYWMPFYGGYGLHDALWRSYFGEDVYQYDGSHGCINLPYYAAELLYENIKVGDTVVVHF